MSSGEVVVTPAQLLGFTVLGLAVLIHIIFVSITLGVGLITAVYRWLAYKRSDGELELFARKAFRLMIVTELFSGVWGTIITVVLVGFFPGLVALATNVLFTPITIAIVSIMIRIPSIAIFWYTWGKISERAHSTIGFIMALSGFGVPLGFRTLFSELSYPHTISVFLAGNTPPLWYAYTSPLYWSLYAHTVFAVISTGGFVIASIMVLENNVRWVEIGLKYGILFLLAQLIAGPLYYLTIYSRSTYIFNNITFGPYAPLFALKLILVLLLLILSLYSWFSVRRRKTIIGYTKYLGPIALLIVFLGEFINNAPRYPYIAVLGESGVPISAFFNFYMNIPASLVYVILGFLIFSIIVFTFAAYLALIRGFIVEKIES
ncbi:MAG: cytochrome ubiquinol oxidase subunit I [Acidilobaceae archaeon]